ncbi:MAG: redox-regulated ATPase YchF [SAR202 cluster bacterium]|nr:redox-regulated ATPase YchF [SAR202 cluster bacterium]|tara:strand:- start:4062 stop:5147 length:1086 start_codon:yes stop_codon:yes gene_type:complete
MQVGIVGLPQSGKTTLFKAATRGKVQSGGKHDLSRGIAKIEDARLNLLSEIHDSQKTTSAEVLYLDSPPLKEGFGKHVGIEGDLLAHLQACDELVIVTREFINDSVAHIHETLDPARDVVEFLMDLSFVDQGILERRLSKLNDSLKSTKTKDKEPIIKEQELLNRISASLNEGKLAYQAINTTQEAKSIKGFGLLTTKPLIVAANIDENSILSSSDIENEICQAIGNNTKVISICAKLEAELSEMNPEDEMEFRSELHIEESGINRLVSASYESLGLITFFTTGPDETRAWSIKNGTEAQVAAGQIHSDIQRGFIRAEIISYEALIKSGNENKARTNGLLRQEGKNYTMQDGDVVNFLFNV